MSFLTGSFRKEGCGEDLDKESLTVISHLNPKGSKYTTRKKEGGKLGMGRASFETTYKGYYQSMK